jgi:hypothetical protein
MGQASVFFPWVFLLFVAVVYLASALVGATAWVLSLCFRAPARAGVVVGLFVLSAGAWGLLLPASLTGRIVLAGLFALASLPVSITYCAVAGVRWRSPRPAPEGGVLYDVG